MQVATRIARALALLCFAAAVGWPAVIAAQDDPAALERRVKAAFLYKFTGYVAWPVGTFPRPDSPMTIGVMGDDLLASEVAQLIAGRTVDGRPLAVKRVAAGESVSGVHILFVGQAEAPRLAQVIKGLPAAPMLVVTESEAAFKQGGAINFVLLEGRVRFDVSQEAAERRGIRLSSRLLAVARNVHGAPQ